MRVTRKGQVTVPKRFRDKFGITTETPVEFLEERGRLILVKKDVLPAVRRIRGRLKRLPFGKDVDGFVRAIRGS
jgi:AbrB family looped-hinge helix DNA binding protein